MKYITFEEFEYLYSLNIPITGILRSQNTSSPVSYSIYYSLGGQEFIPTHVVWERLRINYRIIQLEDKPHTKWLVPK